MRMHGGSLAEVVIASVLVPMATVLLATATIPGLRTMGRLYDDAVVNAQLVRLDTLALRAARRVRQPAESQRTIVHETLNGVRVGFVDGDQHAYLTLEQTDRSLRLDIDGERHEFPRLRAAEIVVAYRPLPHLLLRLERPRRDASGRDDSPELIVVAPFGSLTPP